MLRLRSFIPVADLCVSRFAISPAVQIKTGVRNMSSFTPLRPNFPEELITPEIERAVSLATASSKEIYKHNVGLAVRKYQAHTTDTGSASVQSKLIMLILFFSFSSHFHFILSGRHHIDVIV